MDTPTKFQRLTQDALLEHKRVLDVGCNLGMMCFLALEQGADVIGIDQNRDYIEQARFLFPDIEFRCLRAEDVFGNYDIIIASSLFHYIRDWDGVLNQFARCSKQVLCDVWLNDSPEPIFTLSHRNIYIPSKSAFYNIAGKYFKCIEEKGEQLSPDISKRYIFHLSQPTPIPVEAVLIRGESATGKNDFSDVLLWL